MMPSPLKGTSFVQLISTRSKIISYIRRFLAGLHFLEADDMIVGAPHPFVSYQNELKMVVVGGFDWGRVYVIGKQFRNEGIDVTLPVFTTCEFCMAFADYNDLMELTEKLLSGMVQKLTGGYKIKYHANGLDQEPVEIDFTPPFRRIDMIEELQKVADLNIPEDLSSDDANRYLAEACAKYDVKCTPPLTTTRLLDKLVGHFLEETCVNPTFIINHPEIMSLLAKLHRSKRELTEHFKLFVNKHELCIGYTGLNDPVKQLQQRFSDQLKVLRQSGDDEAVALDEILFSGHEYRLPPTGGWELHIDRLVMLLTDSQNLEEVILFPVYNQVQISRKGKEYERTETRKPNLQIL